MTREEEIQNYAYNNCINDDVDDTSYSLIVEAARWADETMIKKACDWIKKSLYYTQYKEHCFDTSSFIEFIEEFKKAMEE